MIAIVDYRAGNLTSVELAFQALGVTAEVTSDPARVLAAERVVFPGVGAIGAAMAALTERQLIPALRTVIARGTPFLGICIGMQVLFDRSEEDGGVDSLGILPGQVRRFRPGDRRDKVPQIGWNTVKFARPHPLFAGIRDESEFYFVHSFYPDPAAAAHRLGETEYAGARFAAVAGRGALVATQFHPERSGRLGLQLLRNFTTWDGRC